MSTVQTTAGAIRGSRRDGVTSFLGVPYAAPPVGPALYAAPQPVAPWDGVREATTLSPTAPQSESGPPFDSILHNVVDLGDDFLTVNVWTPDPGTSGLPVLVWLPGGAFLRGSNAIPMYDGHNFARDGVVLVSVNYRLGAPGFAALADAPDNRGLLDQIAALEWVRDNVAAFGGDPDRVTVWGESAGAISVLALVASPAAKGLFRRAISQSGSARSFARSDDMALPTAALAERLGVAATAAGLGAVSLAAMLEQQAAVAEAMRLEPDPVRWGRTTVVDGCGLVFFPTIEGDVPGAVVPIRPEAGIFRGAGAEIDLLIGTTAEEFRYFTVPTGLADQITADMLDAMAAQQGWPAAMVELYARNRPTATPGEVFSALMTDSFFRAPSLRVAEAHARHGGRTFVYEFAWHSPHRDLGAAHALDLPFAFDNLHQEGADWLTGPGQAPAAVAEAMHGAWVAFATDGTPGWAPYDQQHRAVRILDDAASPDGAVVALDPRGDERVMWDQVFDR